MYAASQVRPSAFDTALTAQSPTDLPHGLLLNSIYISVTSTVIFAIKKGLDHEAEALNNMKYLGNVLPNQRLDVALFVLYLV